MQLHLRSPIGKLLEGDTLFQELGGKRMCRNINQGGRRCGAAVAKRVNGIANKAAEQMATLWGVERKVFRDEMAAEMKSLGDIANPGFVHQEDLAEPASLNALLTQQKDTIMDNQDISAAQRDKALTIWGKVTQITERWRRAFCTVMGRVIDGSFTKKFAALGVAGALVFGLSACGGSGDEPNGYKTPPAPISVSSSESPTSDASTSPTPQDEGLIKYGGADPASVKVPQDIKVQYGDAAGANIAKDGIAALVEGLGNQNALKAGAKTQADFTAVQPFVTPEVWNDFDPNVETASTPADRAIAGISTIADGEGRIPLGNGQYIKDAQSISTVGQPVIRTLSREDFIRDHQGDSLVEMGVTYKVAFHGTNTETGKQEQVTYTVAASFALAPTADGKWLIADANNDVPVASAVTAW